MKKALLLMLAAALLLGGCGTQPPQDTGDTDSGSDTANTTAAPELPFEVKDFNNAKICIISGEHAEYEYMVGEGSGDVVNDAVYERNRTVEELLNVDFEFVSKANWTQEGEFYSLIRGDVQAGDSTYDIVNGLNCWTTPLIFDGIFQRLDLISTIDFDNPWWVPGLSLDGSDEVWYAFSDASMSLYKDLYVLFFNQSIIEKNKMESPYDMVRDGSWTLDAFLKLAREGSSDLSGDGTVDVDNDQMAYVAKHAANRAFMTSVDTSVFVTGSDGVPTVGNVSERLTNAYEKLRPFFFDKELTYITEEPDMILLSKPFIEGRVLFLNNCLMAIEGMRNMEDDFGIVPLPKYDEAQEEYRSQIATSTSALYIPKTVEDPEMLGTVMEALGYYSHKDVIPTYYETALNVKYARDETVQEMLALVRDNASTNIDFSYNTIFWTNDVMNAARDDVDIASWWASRQSEVEATLAKYLDIDLES